MQRGPARRWRSPLSRRTLRALHASTGLAMALGKYEKPLAPGRYVGSAQRPPDAFGSWVDRARRPRVAWLLMAKKRGPPPAPTTRGHDAWCTPCSRWLLLIALAVVFVPGVRPPRSGEDARSRIAARRPAPSSLNLVVVTLDTLRADRLGCYGFRGVGHSPHRRPGRGRRRLRAGHLHPADDAALPRLDLHRPHPSPPRGPRQRGLLRRGGRGRPWPSASRRGAGRPGPSSGPGCWTGGGASTRASTTTRTASTSRSTRSSTSGRSRSRATR